ncbi:glycosyltransferase family 61 protein [Halorubrum sp. 2020YC2]|uniref:glycosyltransferase family 61 protein n=1 Tax=Halorubrum sp. 2020YC2 TaxID=2836432 RepID=UPI001BE5979C|nr:glycosyltransferase family 61 protein [Halorubrum sp. 2020YC2]QWC20181.1 glycosyltransferase family 61 protein [Halorubrum sp. 2020YC2]
MFDPLVQRELIETTSRDELRANANQVVPVPTPQNDPAEPFVALVGTGRILSETGLALTDRFGIIEESAAEPEQAQQAMMAMLSRELFYGHIPFRELFGRSRSPRDTSVTLDTVAPLVPRYRNYYHWMVETVPKIRYLRAFESPTQQKVTLLVPSNVPPFIEETLRLLSWPQSKVAYATESTYLIRDLVIPSYPERHPSDFEWIRRDIVESVLSESEPLEESNVYVSRSDAIERRVLNEEEVMGVLSDYGFKRYHLENRSLAENVRLFNQADIVVGPHGAGLTDIIFAEDCTLIELFGDKVKQPYELLAETLEIEYEPMYCRADGADIIVDTEKLENRISTLVK